MIFLITLILFQSEPFIARDLTAEDLFAENINLSQIARIAQI
jgi:hypothetical protein